MTPQVLSASKALPAATGSASDISTTSASMDDSTASYCVKLDGGTEGHSAAYKDDFRHPATPPRTTATATPSAPVHTCAKFSYLSSERITKMQHSGLINLGIVIILATNSRLILENITKYGLRATPLTWLQRAISVSTSSNRHTLVGFIGLGCCILAAWAIEFLGKRRLQYEQYLEAACTKKGDSKSMRRVCRARALTDAIMCLLHLTFSVSTPLLIPVLISLSVEPDPLPLGALTFASIVTAMKLVSYAMCNGDFRNARRFNELRVGERGAEPAPSLSASAAAEEGSTAGAFKPTLVYPENVTPQNLLYFMVAPTLVYQMEYPKTERIRKRWLLRRIVELVVYLGLMLFLVDQYVEPAILNSIAPLRESNPILVVERVLKLSLPCMYVWLTIFYVFFHLFLNVVAELTFFADREFYKDWWNASTIGEYWRLWNMPVHKWMIRSVYGPVVYATGNKALAGAVVFFVSGVLHEMAVGVPLRMWRYWAFGGMMAQLPMMFVTAFLKKRTQNEVVGNMFFWLSFCIVGQPICALLYYHDYLLEHSPQHLDSLKHR